MPSPSILFTRIPKANRRWLEDQLREETIGGALLLTAAVIAMVWANSPWSAQYEAFVSTVIGIPALHLDLTVGEWAADGLLAIFFFVVGLELKHELTLGTLSRPARAAVPIAAALGGMAVPALIYTGINAWAPDGSSTGWGIPMATDIAFALAVLAIVGRRLPVALRAFLLTLAVVDDLGAITVIAVFYTEHVSLTWLAASLTCLAAYAWAQHRRLTVWWVYVPLAILTWGFMHASGVHATLAGVALGLLTRARPDSGEEQGPADRIQHRIHPISAGIAVPLFALTAAGIPLAGIDVLDALTSPIALGVAIGLVVGKPIGVAGTAWLVARFTRASLAPSITWADVTAIGILAGIGFTVALLITELAYEGTALLADAKLAVLFASVIAGVLASIVLLSRSRRYAQLPADTE